jgi:hypothetical protein
VTPAIDGDNGRNDPGHQQAQENPFGRGSCAPGVLMEEIRRLRSKTDRLTQIALLPAAARFARFRNGYRDQLRNLAWHVRVHASFTITTTSTWPPSRWGGPSTLSPAHEPGSGGGLPGRGCAEAKRQARQALKA